MLFFNIINQSISHFSCLRIGQGIIIFEKDVSKNACLTPSSHPLYSIYLFNFYLSFLTYIWQTKNCLYLCKICTPGYHRQSVFLHYQCCFIIFFSSYFKCSFHPISDLQGKNASLCFISFISVMTLSLWNTFIFQDIVENNRNNETNCNTTTQKCNIQCVFCFCRYHAKRYVCPPLIWQYS